MMARAAYKNATKKEKKVAIEEDSHFALWLLNDGSILVSHGLALMLSNSELIIHLNSTNVEIFQIWYVFEASKPLQFL